MKKLLWIGDAVVETGFSRATHEILNVLRHTWDVNVLGLNYWGDPHELPYKVWPAAEGFKRDDPHGKRRCARLITELKPDVVVLLNDPWNIPGYLERVGNIPAVGYIAVDGKNCRGNELNGLACAVFWTEFALTEAANGGYRGRGAVVPLGVDREVYKPRPQQEARTRIGLPTDLNQAFIVGNVNRNQPRKRFDLTMKYFATWVHENDITDAYLFLHVAPTGDDAVDVSQMARYLGIARYVIAASPAIGSGISQEALSWTYNAFNVQVTTTQGEGFGLTTLEGMASGIPQVVPDWSALGEICEDAAIKVSCPTTAATPNRINVIGGIPDEREFVKAMDTLYRDQDLCKDMGARGIELASQDRYDWGKLGELFGNVLDQTTTARVMQVADGEGKANG